MKRILPPAALAAALIAVSVATAATPTVHVTIRHQTMHCHTWSVDGGTWKAAQTVRLARGGTIAFVNNDVMPHKLVQVAGPVLGLPKAANMNKMAARFSLTFTKAGTYKFKTVAGEDYMKGVKTMGDDNVLTLRVTVS